jgi:Xaa-Pro aminopeptidase
MKYTKIDPTLFIENRKKLAASLPEGSIAVLVSNDIMPSNADGSMGFKQNSDLFYLTGVDQEETTLVLFPGAANPAHREILFLRETNEHIAVWEGAKLSKEEAQQRTGISTVKWNQEFKSLFRACMAEAETVYLNRNEHIRASAEVQTREDRFMLKCKEEYPLHQYRRLAPLLYRQRSLKHPIEIDLMRQACAITESGFRRLLKTVRPGIWEYEIEAELCHEFIRLRSNGFAYSPIIASGASACVLHYTENNRQCQAGQALLLDIGADYANYASDLTRVIPVSGRFTQRQRQVYDAVLRVQRHAIGLLQAGMTFSNYNASVGIAMQEALIELGLISSAEVKAQNPDNPAYKKYFMHGTSHFLGIDVHDVGYFHEPMQAGMVFTVEPGIYIPEEGIGIRLENDVLITLNGVDDLMAKIPIEADEIEDLMLSGK